MSDDRTIELLRMRAEGCLERNNLRGAIDLLERALAIEADHADLHALLSLCLTDLRFPDAARAEAELALGLDPMEAVAHRAMAQVLLAEGKRREALRSLELAVELEPEFAPSYVALSQIQRMLGQPGEAALVQALELAPDDPSVLAAFSRLEFERAHLDEAERYAREALESNPEHGDALVAMGWVLLRRGQLDDAREHAAMALRADPSDSEALRLLAAYKARRNWFLGLWFRWNMAMSTIGDRKSILVLLVLFLVYRLAAQILTDLDMPDAARIIQYVWLAFVAYTWIGPGVFNVLLRRELDEIRLDPKY
jgi:tetratricopeptide (TPR) repeat protein